MDSFAEALLCKDTDKIPPEYDWFAPLLGDWDFDYYDGQDGGTPRHVVGEWLFRRVLEGAGIEDLFICPSRATREENPQPDGEYGVALRIFDPEKKLYNMAYTANGSMTFLTFAMEEGRLVGTVATDSKQKWAFVEIAEETFHWQNATEQADGSWHVNADVYATRRKV